MSNELSDDVKRKALAAILSVEQTGSTAFTQPKLDPDLAKLDISTVPDWNDQRAVAEARQRQREHAIEEREKDRAPGD